MSKYHARMVDLSSAERKMLEYSWPGNVRELKNVVEYLASLEEPVISAEDLPFRAYDAPASGTDRLPDVRKRTAQPFAESPEDVEQFILTELYDAMCDNRTIGRRQLAERARTRRVFATEGRIKAALAEMNREGLVSSSPGRGGSSITEKGIEKLSKWD